jgi:hypothetical protein
LHSAGFGERYALLFPCFKFPKKALEGACRHLVPNIKKKNLLNAIISIKKVIKVGNKFKNVTQMKSFIS